MKRGSKLAQSTDHISDSTHSEQHSYHSRICHGIRGSGVGRSHAHYDNRQLLWYIVGPESDKNCLCGDVAEAHEGLFALEGMPLGALVLYSVHEPVQSVQGKSNDCPSG